MPTNGRFYPPRDPAAEPVCLLTKEWAERRREPVDALLADADDVRPLANGIEYRFPTTPLIGQRIETFIAEEAECCPFLAFETFDDGAATVLRVIQPVQTGE